MQLSEFQMQSLKKIYDKKYKKEMKKQQKSLDLEISVEEIHKDSLTF